ncbi:MULTISPECIES: GNAT family N-acetyltransferase [Tsukamurella]|uniref:GNAT family N-acetyltransferase n=1 Tax=Tsukamurella strandjordii TaxID=147577 RepID=A0AA90NCC1_9ACTN|nr:MULTISPECIES: GNAT family N-acetyltransferase [Tsukamurella]MDP0397842.1 GNAT family N-acetyltransferase [Tsukamurella strandjordii]GIZ99286.1 acetyltransferase [Tsukamurella sp. TY48]
MLRMLHERPVPPRDLPKVLAVLDADPVAACMVAGRVQEYGTDPGSLGGELWSHRDSSSALCFAGANLMPLRGDLDAMRYFAGRAGRGARTAASVVGRAELVLPLWSDLESSWGPAREVREEQPLMVMAGPSRAPHTGVRPARMAELDRYLDASIAMFTAEVGIDPRMGDGGRAYRRRVANTILSGRAYVLFDGPEVAFKAEVGAVSRTVGQIQGVWVRPDLRGQGLGGAGTAAVADAVRRTGRVPSLYVNSFNTPARRAYERVGFEQVATFATVLLT